MTTADDGTTITEGYTEPHNKSSRDGSRRIFRNGVQISTSVTQYNGEDIHWSTRSDKLHPKASPLIEFLGPGLTTYTASATKTGNRIVNSSDHNGLGDSLTGIASGPHPRGPILSASHIEF